MILSSALSASLTDVLNTYTGQSAEVLVKSAVRGGSINTCFRIEYAGRYYFIKINTAGAYPGMFAAEAESLRIIGGMGAIDVPIVIGNGIAGNEQFLVLAWVETSAPQKHNLEDLGRRLAALHKNTSQKYGFSFNNYMGSLSQSNNYHDTAAGFFIAERIKPQIDIAVRRNLLTEELKMKTRALFDRLHALIPEEPPAFIHGDLWSGNYMISDKGQPVLIDPAISYFHREADISMTALFGGFGSFFYEAYNEYYPLSKGWEERQELWNLYPLLIHLNLFGMSYYPEVKAAVLKYL